MWDSILTSQFCYFCSEKCYFRKGDSMNAVRKLYSVNTKTANIGLNMKNLTVSNNILRTSDNT